MLLSIPLRQKIRKIPTNIKGRDFIIGDLHGCYKALQGLLKKVQFNKSVDRLISVGDLIDRGPDSLECLGLLEKPWFYCVVGNHELMLIHYLQNPKYHDAYELEWIKKIAKNWTEQRQIAGRFLNRLINLPIVLSVGENENHYYVVHAELVDKKMIDRNAIENWKFYDTEKVETGAVWGRQIIQAYRGKKLLKTYKDDIGKVYCGHTIVNAPLKIDKQIYLDKGAYMPHYYGSKVHYKNHEPGLLMLEANSSNAWFFSTENQTTVSMILR